jgi:beta-phosphoglucomutase-like phosphatase (HAD superfamily)
MTTTGALILDVDGVLVDSPHEEAWREALRELMEHAWHDLRATTTWSPARFTTELYQHEIAGKPRLDGARSALACFHVSDDDGSRAAEYAERKQEIVTRLIDAGDFAVYPDAVRFVLAARRAGLRLAAASSSKNARRLLERVALEEIPDVTRGEGPAAVSHDTLADVFAVDVSGRDFAHGKPDPEMFLAAAAELGSSPSEAVVVEDAPAGVRAAKAGGMRAIGVARALDGDLLAGAGADLVVTTLDEVDVDALARGTLTRSRSR